MSAFEVQYADQFGYHTECIEAWDQEAAVQEWRLQHAGQCVHLLDVSFLANVVEEVAA